MKLTSIRSCSIAKDYWATKQVDAVSTYQQAITKYQNKPRTKPKRNCSSLELTEIKTLTLKIKKQRLKEVEAWNLPLLGAATFVEHCWIVKIDATNVNQQTNAK